MLGCCCGWLLAVSALLCGHQSVLGGYLLAWVNKTHPNFIDILYLNGILVFMTQISPLINVDGTFIIC